MADAHRRWSGGVDATRRTGVLCVATDGAVSAVRAHGGTPLWHTLVGGGPDTPLVDDEQRTIYDGAGELTALHARDCRQHWRISIQGSDISSPQIAGGPPCAGTTDNRLLAPDPTWAQ